jgi:hypothetical protein
MPTLLQFAHSPSQASKIVGSRIFLSLPSLSDSKSNVTEHF